jgi:parallel beta-helix repeat protein
VIKSENGSASTTVQAANVNDDVFDVTADCITIDGFTITKADNYGVRVSNVDTCNIENNDITNNYAGIYADPSNNINIVNNELTSNDLDGIARIEDCDTVLISGNLISNNGRRGITNIINATTVTIINNNISYNGWGGGGNPDGIYNITYVNGAVTISGNTIFDNSEDGIDYVRRNNASIAISDNTISYNDDDGIDDIEDNTGPVTISDNRIYDNGDHGIDDVERIDGSVTVIGNIIVNNTGDGIDEIEDYVTGSVTITGNNVSYNGREGIDDIEDVDGSVTITDNIVSHNGKEGFEDIIRVNGAVTIAGNTISNNGHGGVGAGPGDTISDDDEEDVEFEDDDEGMSNEGINDIEHIGGDLLISDNVISNNRKEGIEHIEDIGGSITITGNTISNNGGLHGIGIYADNAMISDNEINDNQHGIWVESDSNEILRNMIARNSVPTPDTGVHLTEFANNNEIHKNCFYDNFPQAIDNGIDNNWDGNYWSPPPGGPGDYTIPGTAGSEDTNPLPECPGDLWNEINTKLDALIDDVSVATMPNIIKNRLIDKLEYAKALKDNAHEECLADNFDAATKKLGVAKSQVGSFASMVEITRRISQEDKESFLADATEIIGKIDKLIEYIETEHKC